MVATLMKLALTAMLALAWRAGAVPGEPLGLRRCLKSTFGLALLLRLTEIAYRQTAPDGARAKLPPAPGKASGL